MKDFWIFTSCFTRCSAQNGRGPFATCFAHMCDITVEVFRFEAAAPSSMNVIHPTMAILSDFTNMPHYGITSTSSFLGRARFSNAALIARLEHWRRLPWRSLLSTVRADRLSRR